MCEQGLAVLPSVSALEAKYPDMPSRPACTACCLLPGCACIPTKDERDCGAMPASANLRLCRTPHCQPMPPLDLPPQKAKPGPSGIEEPLAFFPLTAGSTASLLLPTYNGSLSGAPMPAWVPDPVFGSVVNCSRVRGRAAAAAHVASEDFVREACPYASWPCRQAPRAAACHTHALLCSLAGIDAERALPVAP